MVWGQSLSLKQLLLWCTLKWPLDFGKLKEGCSFLPWVKPFWKPIEISQSINCTYICLSETAALTPIGSTPGGVDRLTPPSLWEELCKELCIHPALAAVQYKSRMIHLGKEKETIVILYMLPKTLPYLWAYLYIWIQILQKGVAVPHLAVTPFTHHYQWWNRVPCPPGDHQNKLHISCAVESTCHI